MCEVHFFRPLLSSYLSQNSKGATLEFKWLFKKEFVNTGNQHLTKKVNSELLLLFFIEDKQFTWQNKQTGTKGITL